jgi:hypothetical protein
MQALPKLYSPGGLARLSSQFAIFYLLCASEPKAS